ncbi:MAG: oligosaccharide flippase family protein [Elusimicrobia bacterium]|nr:oligosaccharide flippase family protein [Elusimicrobiota bacterium]
MTVGFGVSRTLTVIINLSAGRLLGPHDFGLYNLGVAISGGMLPVLSWGMGPANARFASAHGSRARDIHSTAILLQGILLLFGLALVLALRPALVSWLRISGWLFNGALALGVGQAVFLFVVSVSQVESRFRERAVVEALFAFVFGAVFAALFISGTEDYRSILYALSAGYGMVGVGVLFRERARWAGGFSREWAPRLLGFGVYWMVDMVSFFMQALFLRLLTKRFLPASDVGIISLTAWPRFPPR